MSSFEKQETCAKLLGCLEECESSNPTCTSNMSECATSNTTCTSKCFTSTADAEAFGSCAESCGNDIACVEGCCTACKGT